MQSLGAFTAHTIRGQVNMAKSDDEDHCFSLSENVLLSKLTIIHIFSGYDSLLALFSPLKCSDDGSINRNTTATGEMLDGYRWLR